jgi:hypothetical protein
MPMTLNSIDHIGEDLLSISVDQPFRFPATFTFVVRAFSGIETCISSTDLLV